MSELHSTVLTEFEKTSAKVWPTLTLELPSGTIRMCRAQDTGVNSLGHGHYVPRVESFGSIESRASAWLGGLEAMEATIRIDDHDKVFSREVARSSRALRRSTATIRFLSDGYSYDNAFKITLQLASWEQQDGLQWDLVLRPNDRWVESNLLKLPILKGDWPNAAADSYALAEPIVYGVHDSRGSTGKGAIPLISVDTVGLRYLVTRGWAMSVDRVYVDGVLLRSTEWSVSRGSVNHRFRTLVTLLNDPIPDNGGSTPEISADVTGLDSVGDGSGTLIQNPVDCLRHLLTNFGWNEYKEGLWFTETGTPIKGSLFDDTHDFCEAKDHRMSRRYSGPAAEDERNFTMKDAIQEVCLSFGLRCWWTWDGIIGLGVYRDHRVPESSRPWVKWDLHAFQESPVKYKDENPATSLTGKFLFLDNENKFLESVQVINPNVDPVDSVSQTLEFRASYASVV